MRVAFIGKGGSGKSVIAGTTARLLARRGMKVLALDFDTMPGLAYTIGVGAPADAGLPEALAVRRKKTGWGLRRRILATTLVQRHAITGPDGVQFLQLGKLPDGVKPASSVAFRHVADTFRRPGWAVVGDMAAGTRQSFFGWAGFASALVIVVEPSMPSILSARRLVRLREHVPDAAIGLVVSKARPETAVDVLVRELDLPLWGVVPYDVHVRDAERQGLAVVDVAANAPAVQAIDGLVGTLQSIRIERES